MARGVCLPSAHTSTQGRWSYVNPRGDEACVHFRLACSFSSMRVCLQVLVRVGGRRACEQVESEG